MVIFVKQNYYIERFGDHSIFILNFHLTKIFYERKRTGRKSGNFVIIERKSFLSTQPKQKSEVWRVGGETSLLVEGTFRLYREVAPKSSYFTRLTVISSNSFTGNIFSHDQSQRQGLTRYQSRYPTSSLHEFDKLVTSFTLPRTRSTLTTSELSPHPNQT